MSKVFGWMYYFASWKCHRIWSRNFRSVMKRFLWMHLTRWIGRWPFWMSTRNTPHFPNCSSIPTDTTLSSLSMVRHCFPRKEPPRGTPLPWLCMPSELCHWSIDWTNKLKQVLYADDATAGGKLYHLYSWWNQLLRCGPDYGYHANASKTWLVVKQEHLPLATGVQITVEGRRYLDTALGTGFFTEAYICQGTSPRMGGWNCSTIFHWFQPTACCICSSISWSFQQWTYLMRTQPDISDLLKPPKEAIHHSLIPALTGRRDGWWHCLLQSITLPCIKAPFAMHFVCGMVGNPRVCPLIAYVERVCFVEHALSCSCGGLPSIRHNNIGDYSKTVS